MFNYPPSFAFLIIFAFAASGLPTGRIQVIPYTLSVPVPTQLSTIPGVAQFAVVGMGPIE
jgi:hypothetical protein